MTEPSPIETGFLADEYQRGQRRPDEPSYSIEA